MNPDTEITLIENTLKIIFNKDRINKQDVFIANKLLHRWKKIKRYKEDTKCPIFQIIIDDEPNFKK